MLITANSPQVQAYRAPAAAAPAVQEEPIASVPQESFTLSSDSKSHYSGGSIVGRAVSGALTGLGAHYFTGGDIGATAKLGAVINGVGGAVVGGIGGAAVGAVAGNPLLGAASGAAVVGGVSAATGAVKGALLAYVGTAVGGGPLAFAASGAILGAIGL